MNSAHEINEIFSDAEIVRLTENISAEFANRGLFLRDFIYFVKAAPERHLAVMCTKFHSLVQDVLFREGMLERLISIPNKPAWLAMAVSNNITDGQISQQDLVRAVCMGLLECRRTSVDGHIDALMSTDIIDKLGIVTDDNILVDLSDARFDLKPSGIIFGKTTLVYPHQFLRRYYSDDFVGMPILLDKAKQAGQKVYLRLDPLRITNAENYREGPFMADAWFGRPFSEKMLMDKWTNDRTLHRSTGLTNMTYDAAFTIFRTKMMDSSLGLREFMIEEYCPLFDRRGKRSCGVGERRCIQKFAHLVYDQNKRCFIHLDGAVRILSNDEYAEHFDAVSSGIDVDEKIGERHKLFLIEGELDRGYSQEVLTEWFRYNSHIEEYFTGINIKPFISYENYDAIVARSAL